jgi:hypothetical protein
MVSRPRSRVGSNMAKEIGTTVMARKNKTRQRRTSEKFANRRLEAQIEAEKRKGRVFDRLYI